MKRFLFGLFCLAVAGPLQAQTPAAPKTDAAVQTVSHNSCDSCGKSCCNNKCDTCGKVCVSECYNKVTPRVVYGSKCIDYCLPTCPRFSLGLGHGCCNTACTTCAENCGPVRSKRVLLKKVVNDECPATRCVVQLAPACGTVVAPATTAPVERVPAPLPKGATKE